MKVKQFYNFLLLFLKHNILFVMFWGGMFLLFLGAFFADYIETLSLVPKGAGEFLLKSGSAILGAGVFGSILKSTQFTQIFQTHIADVIFSPDHDDLELNISGKWKKLTEARLKAVVPNTYIDATNNLDKLLFDEDEHYHLENHVITIDINVDQGIAEIQSKTASLIVVTEGLEKAEYEWEHQCDAGEYLTSPTILFNGAPPNEKDKVEKVAGDGNSIKFNVNLNDYLEHGSTINLEREITTKQKLSEDPLIIGRVARYVKGLTIRAKINGDDDYSLYFAKFGVKDLPKDRISKLENGYKQWILGQKGELLFPGQGYILCIVRNINSKV